MRWWSAAHTWTPSTCPSQCCAIRERPPRHRCGQCAPPPEAFPRAAAATTWSRAATRCITSPIPPTPSAKWPASFAPEDGWSIADTQSPDDAWVASEMHDIETIRDPSHGRNLSGAEFPRYLRAAGLVVAADRECRSPMDFDQWVARSGGTPTMADELWRRMSEPRVAAAFDAHVDAGARRFAWPVRVDRGPPTAPTLARPSRPPARAPRPTRCGRGWRCRAAASSSGCRTGRIPRFRPAADRRGR